MASKQFLVPGNHATVRGIVAPGATASLYTTGTTTPQAFYSDETRLVSLGSTITADAIGNFPIAYQDETVAFRLILKDRLGAELSGGDIDPFYFGVTTLNLPASAGSYATRTAMAAVSPVDGSLAHLHEAGREGRFDWSTDDLSDEVTLDTKQAIYVAPASDTTGASGAWVRKYSGAVDIKWFGAVGDAVTDDYAAIQAAIDFFAATGGSIFMSKGVYRCSARLVNTAPLHLFGPVQAQGSTGATLSEIYLGATLYFDAGVAGFLNRYVNADDVSGGPAIYKGGSNTVIENIRYQSAGGDKAVYAGKYGIESRSRITLRNVEVRAFGDHGVYIRGSLSGSDGVVYGNANNSVLHDVRSLENGSDGFKLSGNDANNITLLNCHGQDNAGWDFTDDGFINNSYLTCLSEGGDLGAFRTIRSGAVHTYIGCNTEGGTSSILGSCSVIGGSMGQIIGAGGFTWTGGIAQSLPIRHVNTVGTAVGAQLGSTSGNVAFAWGASNGANYAEWRMFYNPGGASIAGTWALNYTGSSAIIPICLPDVNTRSGRDYAPEFPRGIVIGEPDVAGSMTGKIQTGTAAPVAGTWVRGDIVINRAPSAAGTWAWLCTTAGTPGTWQALNAATGSNTGDQTITLTGAVTGTGTGSFATSLDAASAVAAIAGQAIAPASSAATGAITSSSATAGIGYATGAGGAITQVSSRTTGVTLDKICGAITLVSAAGTATWQTFTVTNSTVAATDVIRVSQKSGADLNMIHVTNVAAGSFKISFATTGGTTTEQPVFNFAVIKAVAA